MARKSEEVYLEPCPNCEAFTEAYRIPNTNYAVCAVCKSKIMIPNHKEKE